MCTCLLRAHFIVQELCESRGGRPGLSVLTSLLVSVDVKQHCSGGGPRPPPSSGSVRAVEPSLSRPPPTHPPSPSVISILASVDVKQNVYELRSWMKCEDEGPR